MASKRYTIKDLADELGVTKPGIRKLLTDSFRKQYTETTGNKILINNAGARIIRKHFENSKPKTEQKPLSETKNGYQKQPETVSNSPENTVISAKDETIKLLKEQLKAKDDQLANMQKLMDQNQQLLLHTQEENKHLLALNTPDKDNKVQSVHDGEYHEAPKTADKDSEPQEQTDRSNEEKKPWWKLW
ncbi:DUF536 domain-containing protein [Limosilactobacillus pontis]|uniref:DUF536 domain-containing protein n=1 Tax=Limosilactobacillus pontis TaxID=35787 RepID=UPI0025A4CAE2|nr:DUF536 domain-containing protein [Limosilactobacillus pontis]MDM8332531.1 DUF536 domain-containing protein [Limosilactobacillus pontis]